MLMPMLTTGSLRPWSLPLQIAEVFLQERFVLADLYMHFCADV